MAPTRKSRWPISVDNVKMGMPDDKRLEQALLFAGDNRNELEKVLSHYENNPEKLEAAHFLISLPVVRPQ